MADLTTEDLYSIGAERTSSAGVLDNVINKNNQLQEQKLKQESASAAAKTMSFFAQIPAEMYPVGWFQEANFMAMSNDDKFEIDDEQAMQLLQDNGLSMAYFGDIRNSKSQAEVDKRLKLYKSQEETQRFIMNSLDTDGIAYKSATFMGMGLGMAVEVAGDVAVGNVAGALGAATLGVANRIRTIQAIQSTYKRTHSIWKFASVGTAEIGLAAAKASIDPNYDELSFATDVVIGIGASTIGSSAFDNYRHTALEAKYSKARDDLFKDFKATDDIMKSKSSMLDEAKKFDDEIAKLDDEIAKLDETLKTNKKDLDAELKKKDIEARKKDIEVKRNEIQVALKREDDLYTLAIHKTAVDKMSPSMKKVRDLIFYKEIKAFDSAKTPLEQLKAFSENKNLIQFDFLANHLSKNSGELKEIIAQNLNRKDIAEIIRTFKKEDPEKYKLVNELLKARDIDDIEKVGKKLEKAGGMKLTGKQVAAVVAIAGVVAPTEAMASDGDVSFNDVTALVALGIFGLFMGSKAVTALKRSASDSAWYGMDNVSSYLKQALDEAGAKTDMTMRSGKFYKIKAWFTNVMDTKLTGLKSYFKSPDAQGLIDELALSPESVDMTRRILVEGNTAKLDEAEKIYFEKFLEEIDVSNNFIKNVDDQRAMFNTLASEYKMGIGNIDEMPQAVKDYVDETSKILEELYTYAADVGAYGYKTVVKKGFDKNHLPRFWRSQKLGAIVKELSDLGLTTQLETLHGALTDGFMSALKKKYPKRTDTNIFKQAQSEANSMIDHWLTDPATTLKREMDNDSIEVLRGYLKDDVDMDALLTEMGNTSEMSARARKRLDFDIGAIKNIDITLNGRTITLGRNDFIDMDYQSIMKRAINTIGSDSALAKHGFESKARLRAKIQTVTRDPEELENLNLVADMLEGKPISSGSRFIDDTLSYVSAATAVTKLSLVGLSTFPEIFNVLTTNGLLSGIKSLSQAVVLRYGKGNRGGNVFKVAELTGLASFGKRIARSGFVDITDTDYIISNATTGRRWAKKISDKAMQYNGLSFLSDTAQLGGINIALDKIAKYIETGKGFNAGRLKDIGLDEAFVKKFKQYVENGKMKDLDLDAMDMDTKLKFASVVRNIVQGISPETMLRDTGLWTRTGTGRILTPLLTYTQTVFNEQGLKGIAHMDSLAAIQTLNATIGGYVGMTIRDEIVGRSRDDDVKIWYSMLNTPILGAVSTFQGILNPAPLGVMKDAYNMLLPRDVEVR